MENPFWQHYIVNFGPYGVCSHIRVGLLSFLYIKILPSQRITFTFDKNGNNPKCVSKLHDWLFSISTLLLCFPHYWKCCTSNLEVGFIRKRCTYGGTCFKRYTYVNNEYWVIYSGDIETFLNCFNISKPSVFDNNIYAHFIKPQYLINLKFDLLKLDLLLRINCKLHYCHHAFKVVF